ncbi:HD domain-containing protein [Virgibacillus sp. W0430]|uniref:HD domain-containing protein n=1 Tax=Virgibacillus sp. W0430 TaxID=3391580 RepID=UPI003F45266E
MINKAINFATVAHSNQTRKGTVIPYILHCLEAGTIAANLSMKNGKIDEDVVAAAILHDTIEDTFVSYESLREIFNENIADLVQSQSEDKSKMWLDRKQAMIDFLKANKSIQVEIAVLADKLSNIRSIYRDYQIMQEALWKKFNADKNWQYWYYQSIADALSQIRYTAEFKEYKALITKTFES